MTKKSYKTFFYQDQDEDSELLIIPASWEYSYQNQKYDVQDVHTY